MLNYNKMLEGAVFCTLAFIYLNFPRHSPKVRNEVVTGLSFFFKKNTFASYNSAR